MNRTRIAVVTAALVATLTGCSTDAEVASRNLSQEADNFQVPRRVVFLNGITDKVILSIEGNCSVIPNAGERKVEVVCKLPDGRFIKHAEGLSDNVTWFSQQLSGVDVSTKLIAKIAQRDAPARTAEAEIGRRDATKKPKAGPDS